jgi:hypothetical protein
MIRTTAFPRGEHWTGLIARWNTPCACTATTPAPSLVSSTIYTGAPPA